MSGDGGFFGRTVLDEPRREAPHPRIVEIADAPHLATRTVDLKRAMVYQLPFRDASQPNLSPIPFMRTSQTELLIVGASTRAAAASAVRAGFHPVCVDRFGDDDLRRIATVVAVENDLRNTLDAVKALPPMPWIYIGSVENDPKFIAAVSERHTLLGNPPSVLKKVRDPFWLERTLRTCDLPALRVRSVRSLDALVRAAEHSDEGVQATDKGWLLKPTRGGGGCRIAVWSGQPPPTHERFYLQEHRLGTPMSALFIASPTKVELIGVCEQLIGPAAGAPTEFGYAGSIGPIEVSQRTCDLLQRIGDTLTREALVRGMFGIDFVLANEVPWLVEVNPRYTASVEVLERATGRALLAEETSVGDFRTATVKERSALSLIVGKQIVYAVRDVTVPALEQLFESEGHRSDVPLIADIPAPGSRILAGWPICTVFAEASSVAECRTRIEARHDFILGCLDCQ